MKVHIVGGGCGRLAAALCLIRNAEIAGQNITIEETNERLGGVFSLACRDRLHLTNRGHFDAEFRCGFDLLPTIPSVSCPLPGSWLRHTVPVQTARKCGDNHAVRRSKFQAPRRGWRPPPRSSSS